MGDSSLKIKKMDIFTVGNIVLGDFISIESILGKAIYRVTYITERYFIVKSSKKSRGVLVYFTDIDGDTLILGNSRHTIKKIKVSLWRKLLFRFG